MSEAARILSITPIEFFQLSGELSSVAGSNRATGLHAQISAQNDVDAIKAWLGRFVATKTTFDSYRKEAERLLLWSVMERGKPLSSLTHEDLLIYQKFLSDPQPSSRWIMKTGKKLPHNDPGWRPFSGPLAASSQRQSIVILNALFSWLVDAGYLAGNPLSLSRHRQLRAKPRITRFLEEDLWVEVKTTINSLPQETDRQRAHYFRVRWLFSFLYICGVRISEVTENTMGNFFYRKDVRGIERWWIEITGKCNKTRIIPATSELMVELVRYRRENGFAPYPIPGETTPLLLPLGGKSRALTRSAVHLIIKTIFEIAAARIEQSYPDNNVKAQTLRAASAHWLRHTAGTNMTGSKMDLRHVRDNLGHESIATTSRYLHSEDDKRHEDTELKHRMSW